MKARIKNLIKTNTTLLRLVALIHNVFHLSVPSQGNFSGVFLKHVKFKIVGGKATIFCGEKSRLTNCSFYLHGNNTNIHIEENCILTNLELWIEDDNGTITIGKNTTIEGGHIAATEGKSITIGADCMFSSNIQIRNGDSHPILNKDTGLRINHASSTKIGNRVWLGNGVTVLKGSIIADNCVIGTNSLVTGKCLEENAIYAGTPARKVKEGIRWERHRNLYQ